MDTLAAAVSISRDKHGRMEKVESRRYCDQFVSNIVVVVDLTVEFASSSTPTSFNWQKADARSSRNLRERHESLILKSG